MAKSQSSERPEPAPRRITRRTAFFLLAGVVALLVAGMALLESVQSGEIPQGVHFGQLDLGGVKIAEASAKLRTTLATYEAEGMKLQLNEKQLVLEYAVADPNGLGTGADAVAYDIDGTVSDLTSYAAGRSPLVLGIRRFRALLFKVNIKPKVAIDHALLVQGLKNTLEKYEDPVIEPSYTYSATADSAKKVAKGITVNAASPGQVFDYETIAQTVERRVRSAATEPVAVALQNQNPAVSAEEAKTLLTEVETYSALGTVTLHAGTKDILVKPAEYVGWLQPVKNNGKLALSVSDAVIRTYLKDLSPQVSSVAKNAKFQLKDGIVTQIQGSSAGSELDVDISTTTLVKALERKATDVQLAMKDVTPEATSETVANLGVKELVAVGQTNFAGSPQNRRHNIAIAADLLNGILVKPGEEFSLIKTVGPVDATLGYLQELVIKGDRTIPEFGGGLCQIGTTMFRLVMNTGLPILERQNHSYRVHYYEPPVGMDATIYEPKPDFRFRNDYGGYLLLQTRIEGDNLIFEFWGTKDGRTVAISTPKIYNIVPAPEPSTIETTDIPVGTTKCVEKAHVGSDADFTYGVTKDGKTTNTVFKSHYRPWRQLCLVGVKKLSPGSGDTKTPGTNTNTNSNVNSNTNTAPANSNTNSSVPKNSNVNSGTNTNQNSNSNTNS